MFVVAMIFFILAMACVAALVSHLHYENGFRCGATVEVYAQLTDEKVERNVKIRKWEEARHKRTIATYSYIVNGVKYDHSCIIIDRIKRMPASTKLVYQRKKPMRAYLPDFEDWHQKRISIFLLFGMIFFFCMGVIAVFLK